MIGYVSRIANPVVSALSLVLITLPAQAKEPVSPDGTWLTDDKEAVVAIGDCDSGQTTKCGIIVGLPTMLSDSDIQTNVDQLCNSPVLWELKPEADKFVDGKILDVVSEKIYSSK